MPPDVPVVMPVPPLLTAIMPALHVPVVMVPTAAMSVPTRFAAVIAPASMAFVTLPAPMDSAMLPAPVPVTSPVRVTVFAST